MWNRAPVQVLRTLAKWAFWPASILLVLNVEKLGEEFGWDKLLVRHWSPAVSSALDFLLSAWVQYPAVFLLGLTLGIWVDARLWRREQQRTMAASGGAAVPGSPPRPTWTPFADAADGGRISFDYSNGKGPCEVGAGERAFLLRFGERAPKELYFYRDGTNLRWIARALAAKLGDTLDLAALERSAGPHGHARPGDLFVAQNTNGHMLQGRLNAIETAEGADPGSGGVADFTWRIVPGPAARIALV